MFNVLPEIFQEEIKKDYKFRRLLMVMLFIVFLLFSSLIFLFPTWIISSAKEKETVQRKMEVDQSYASQNAEAVSSFVTETNSKLKVISTTMVYPRIVPLLKEVLEKQNSGISIDEFLYTSKDQASANISMSGRSLTRESLVSFVKSLQGSKTFTRVDSPVSNFTKDKNIEFSINLVISEKP